MFSWFPHSSKVAVKTARKVGDVFSAKALGVGTKTATFQPRESSLEALQLP
jgi:hypothetical protein